jgi:hypothetical protein
MCNAFRRGSVVLRGELYGVVWDVRDERLVVLPIMQARAHGRASHRRAHDVDLEFAELLAAAIALPAAFVQAGEAIEVGVSGQVWVGELVGTVLCRIVRAVIRASTDAAMAERWSAERPHRHEGASIGTPRL